MKDAWVHAIAIAVVLVWGVTFISTKVLLQAGMSSTEIFVIRFIIAYACIWLLPILPSLLGRGRRWGSGQASGVTLWAATRRDEMTMLLLGLTGGSMYFVTENEALRHTLANNVSFIVCTAPLFTTLMALAIFRDVRATGRLLAGSAIAIAGMATIIFNGHFVLHLSPVGDLLALAAALCWAIYSLLIRSVAKRYSAVFITRKVFAYGLLTILPFLILDSTFFTTHSSLFTTPLPTGEGSGVGLVGLVVLNLLFLGVIASFVCFAVWSWVVKRIGALSSSNYIYLNPVATCVASAIVLNEPITPIALLGMALTLAGVYIAGTSSR